MVQEAIRKADVLIEALPYIKKFYGKVFVIKYGGSILSEEKVRTSVLEDIAFLRYSGVKPILIHGGGPNINDKLKELKIPCAFIDGRRVTDAQTLKVVEEELNQLNDMIVNELNAHGELAKSVKKDSRILIARKKDFGGKDLGFVGEVVKFDDAQLKEIMESSIPVIVPIAVSPDGVTYNINADDVAFSLAAHLKAEKLVLLTKVLGVMRDPRDEKSLIPTITASEAETLIDKKIISEGMVPKIRSAVKSVEDGVKKAHIVDAKISHAILLEIFTDQGIGTEIVKE